MSELYGDDYDSAATGGSARLIPARLRGLAGAALFLGLIGAMGLWAYRLGTRDAAEVPIIRAMEGPARVQPEEPGGLTTAHQGLEVNEVLAGRPAPAPEVVAPPAQPPVVLTEEDGPQGELVVAAPAPLDAELPADEDLRMPQQDDAAVAALDAADAPPPLDADAAVAAAVAAAVQTVAAQPTDAAEVPDTSARPRGRPANLVLARATALDAGESAPAAPAAREVSSPGAGARLVQLGAFDSEAITRQAWSQLIARHGDLLGAKSLYVERTTANARVFYRLRVAGFENTDQTRGMCEALRARGVDCIPVTLQ